MPGTLTVKNHSTFLKQNPTVQAQALPASDKSEVKANQKIPFSYIEFAEYKGQPFQKHLHVTVHCDPPINSKQTWFLYVDDISKIE